MPPLPKLITFTGLVTGVDLKKRLTPEILSSFTAVGAKCTVNNITPALALSIQIHRIIFVSSARYPSAIIRNCFPVRFVLFVLTAVIVSKINVRSCLIQIDRGIGYLVNFIVRMMDQLFIITINSTASTLPFSGSSNGILKITNLSALSPFTIKLSATLNTRSGSGIFCILQISCRVYFPR